MMWSCCLRVRLSRSFEEITPNTLLSLVTGICRTRCFPMTAMHSSRLASGPTCTGSVSMISETRVVLEESSLSITLRAQWRSEITPTSRSFSNTIKAPTLCLFIDRNASRTVASGAIERTQNPLSSNILCAFMAFRQPSDYPPGTWFCLGLVNNFWPKDP